jgi:hypothetical protein
MKKYFETKDSELCYPLDYFTDKADPKETELVLYEAKIEYNVGYFWCDHFKNIGEVGLGCGLQCKYYKPRNGKNGRCRHSKSCYEVGKKVIIKI